MLENIDVFVLVLSRVHEALNTVDGFLAKVPDNFICPWVVEIHRFLSVV